MRKKKYLSILLIPCLLFSGCQAGLIQRKQPLENEGEIFLYFERFPQEAERLKFNLESISVIGEEGSEFKLDFFLNDFKYREMGRQRLVATARLPQGIYARFLFKVNKASLETESGEAALLVPDSPSGIDFKFQVISGKALVISMVFKYNESISGGFSFSPVFFTFIREKPIPSLVGYVANYGSNTITVFDKKKMEVTGTIATGGGPRGIALSQRQGKAYIVISDEDRVDVVDLSAGEVTGRINLSIGDSPQEPALTPDGNFLLTANTGSDSVSIIDTITLLEAGKVAVGDGPHSVLIDRAGRKAYVFNTLSNNISVIDIIKMENIATFVAGNEPIRGEIDRSGNKLYIICSSFPYLFVIDTSNLSILRREFVGLGMNSIKVDKRTDLFYMGRGREGDVALYNPYSFMPVGYIQTGGAVNYIEIDNEENNLYLLIPERRVLMIINLVSKQTVAEIDVGEDPYWVSITGEN